MGSRCVFTVGARAAEIAQVTDGIVPLHFRAAHEAKTTVTVKVEGAIWNDYTR
jgi:hypothetical protein